MSVDVIVRGEAVVCVLVEVLEPTVAGAGRRAGDVQRQTVGAVCWLLSVHALL
jgi:hypothetical protein